MSDIPKRLRNPPFGTETSERNLMAAAADEIDKHRALIETLTASLEAILCMHDGNPPLPLADMPEIDYARRTISTIHREARTALAAAKEFTE